MGDSSQPVPSPSLVTYSFVPMLSCIFEAPTLILTLPQKFYIPMR